MPSAKVADALEAVGIDVSASEIGDSAVKVDARAIQQGQREADKFIKNLFGK